MSRRHKHVESAEGPPDGQEGDTEPQEDGGGSGSRKSVEYPFVDADIVKKLTFEDKPLETITMICEAVQFLDEEKGSAPDKLISWILGQSADLDPKRFKSEFRRALKKGIADGVLMSTNPTDREGLSGLVKLAPFEKTSKETDTLGARDKNGGPSAPADLKAPPRRRAPKAVKATVAEDVADAPEEQSPQRKEARPHKKPSKKEDHVVDDRPAEGKKVKARNMKKLGSAEPEPAPMEPEKRSKDGQEGRKKASGGNVRLQPPRACKNVH